MTTKNNRLYCTVNPAVHREREFELTASVETKRVMVIGGGLAGMEVARVASLRGHQVTLFEKDQNLGGQWRIACQQPDKKRYQLLLDHQIRGVLESGVEVITNTLVNPALTRKFAPDVVVLATGAAPMILPVPGIDRFNVVQGIDVIQDKVEVGERVVVVGGRLIGMEVALGLSVKGKKVSIVTAKRLGQNGERLEENIYRTLRNRLITAGVQVYPGCPLLEVREDGVYVEDDGDLLFLKADTIVLAVGAEPANELLSELESIVSEIHVIGDCRKPRDALEAMHEGAELGRLL